MRLRRYLALCVGVLGTALMTSCGDDSQPEAPPAPRTGHIIIAGQAVPTLAPVVTFRDEAGYDAYREHCWFDPKRPLPTHPATGCKTLKRYGERSPLGLDAAIIERVGNDGWDAEALAARIDQFVLHYDVSGTSERCFKVLHDRRGLSVHFMLDLDGTIYQTLDLAERARHASFANNRSIGVEIAQMGAYSEAKRLAQWYRPGEQGRLRVVLTKAQGDGGFLTEGFIPRPCRDEVVQGEVQGRALYQHDYTAEQYRSLVLLTKSLRELLPGIRAEVPRNEDGSLSTRALDRPAFDAFSGILGHFHVQTNKIDPGPAFQWERFLALVKEQPGAKPF